MTVPAGSPSTTVDDSPSTSVSAPSTTIDDSPSTTTASLPAAFTDTYASAGGSVTVTSTGTDVVLGSVSAAPGFAARIHDQAWDRIRVEFDGGDVDSRIEVRLNDGRIRVRVD